MECHRPKTGQTHYNEQFEFLEDFNSINIKLETKRIGENGNTKGSTQFWEKIKYKIVDKFFFILYLTIY